MINPDKSATHGEQSLLEKDDISFFVFKKCERISAALYLVSDLIPENEPVRECIRRGALALIELSSLVGSPRRNDESIALLTTKIAEIMAALTVASMAGLVSSMNQDLITRELKRILEVLKRETDIKGNHARALVLEDGFFGGSLGTRLDHDASAHGRIVGSDVWDGAIKRHMRDAVSHTNYQNDLYNKTDNLKKTLMSNRTLSVMNKEGRRSKVLDVIKKKGRVNVRDVSAVVPNCSEKTIQRELIALVAEGVLKKEGERRWSTYVLAS